MYVDGQIERYRSLPIQKDIDRYIDEDEQVQVKMDRWIQIDIDQQIDRQIDRYIVCEYKYLYEYIIYKAYI